MTKKKILDLILLAIFFLELGSFFLPSTLHEILGAGFLILAAIHHRKNPRARFVEILLGICTISLAISGFALMNLIDLGNFNWRSIHLGSSIAALILIFIHCMTKARRYFHGKIFYAAGVFGFILAAGGIFGLPYLDRWFHEVKVDRAEIVAGSKIDFGKNVATIYFSRVGNTDFPPDVDAVSGASIMRDGNDLIGNSEMLAMMIQDAVGGEIFEIRTLEKYPADYSATTQIAQEEFRTKKIPQLESIELGNCDLIFIVYPLWWNSLPMPVESFLSQQNLEGRMIVPIVTHGGGGIGNSIEDLKRVTQAKIMNSLDVYSSDIPSSREVISDFLTRIRSEI